MALWIDEEGLSLPSERLDFDIGLWTLGLVHLERSDEPTTVITLDPALVTETTFVSAVDHLRDMASERIVVIASPQHDLVYVFEGKCPEQNVMDAVRMLARLHLVAQNICFPCPMAAGPSHEAMSTVAQRRKHRAAAPVQSWALCC